MHTTADLIWRLSCWHRLCGDDPAHCADEVRLSCLVRLSALTRASQWPGSTSPATTNEEVDASDRP